MIIVALSPEEATEVVRLLDKELDSIAATFIKLNGAADRKLSKRRLSLQKTRAMYLRSVEFA